MKSGMLIIAVLASVIAGAGGGYVAATYGTPDKGGNKVAVESAPLEMGSDASGSAKDHSDEITALRNDIGAMEVRMQGMVSADEYDKLAKKYDALNKRLDELKAAPVVANNGGGEEGAVAPADPGSDAFKEAVAKAIEEKEAADRAEWQARQEERMKERMVEEKERVLKAMSDKLALSAAQQGTIGTILENYNTKRTEMMERGRTAMQNGETFDWQAERAKIETETQEAIKAELTLSQVSSFTELLGDNDVDDIGEERGGRRGFGGGGNRGGGGGFGGGRGN